MTNPNPDHQFTPETASEAGKKSKRPISLVKALKEMFQKEIDTNGKLTPDFFVKACTMAGIKGNAQMAKMIFEYIDGRVPEKIDANFTGAICNIDKEEYKRIRQEMLDNDDC